jgi:hypothetical protein
VFIEHRFISDAQYVEAVGREHTVALGIIVGLIIVDVAVYFDNETGTMAVEVHDESVNHLLATEVQPVELTAA